METENGSVSTVTFYISKQLCKSVLRRKTIFSVQQCDFFFFSLLRFESSQYTLKTGKKKLQVLMPVMLNSFAVFTDGPSKTLL